MSLCLSRQASRDPSDEKSDLGIQLNSYMPIADCRSTSGRDRPMMSNRAKSERFSLSSMTWLATFTFVVFDADFHVSRFNLVILSQGLGWAQDSLFDKLKIRPLSSILTLQDIILNVLRHHGSSDDVCQTVIFLAERVVLYHNTLQFLNMAHLSLCY